MPPNQKIRERVMNDYPWLVWLMSDPEVGPLLLEAVDPDKGFSINTFQAKLTNTRWWKRQSESHRRWLVIKNTDPATAKSMRQEYRTGLVQTARQMGIKLSTAQIKFLTELGLQGGQDPSSLQVRRGLMGLARAGGVKMGPGALRTATHAVNNVVNGEWVHPMPMHTVAKWGQRIAMGDKTIEDLRAQMAMRAAKRFPHMQQQIANGASVAEIVHPLRAAVAAELELAGPGAVDIKSGKWKQLVEYRDPKTGELRLPTETEAIRMARQDPRWWRTSHGRQTDASIATQIAEAFGKRGGGILEV